METTEQIIEEIKKMGFDVENATPKSLLVNDLGLDSLDAMELITKLEEHYHIKFSDQSIEGCKTISDVASVIDELNNI